MIGNDKAGIVIAPTTVGAFPRPFSEPRKLMTFIVLPATDLQTPDTFLRLMVTTALKECGQ